ncbi:MULTISPECIES: hypothetical protein [unclassified Arthrobacter]|uniref:hypothetical protein n=1 Tax=unclassified Arthrobacter TaxID=235627 RepID=UPI001491365D|nr:MULTISPECIES: hypothetical protein [unclassified Arthrobacter]MBE0010402.1 hypothetical protein [Arthrobacter sp. AET 35A]NOJ64275.1 hypothetical protein [Arthrobacter sp. 147(2020)]
MSSSLDRAEPLEMDEPAARDVSASTAPTADTSLDNEWVRIRLIKSVLILATPVAFLSFLSGVLWLAIHRSTPENFDRIHFWFYFFDVGREINVPTWFSAGLWILTGVVAGYFARKASRFRKSWWLFASVCVFFSLDETLELHERLDLIGGRIALLLPFEVGFTWVIPGIAIAAVLVLLLLRLVLSLPSSVRNGIILAGATFVTGAVVVETLGGYWLDANGMTWHFFLMVLVEETLEMAGVALCLASLLHLLEYRLVDGGTAYRMAERLPDQPRRRKRATRA